MRGLISTVALRSTRSYISASPRGLKFGKAPKGLKTVATGEAEASADAEPVEPTRSRRSRSGGAKESHCRLESGYRGVITRIRLLEGREFLCPAGQSRTRGPFSTGCAALHP